MRRTSSPTNSTRSNWASSIRISTTNIWRRAAMMTMRSNAGGIGAFRTINALVAQFKSLRAIKVLQTVAKTARDLHGSDTILSHAGAILVAGDSSHDLPA